MGRAMSAGLPDYPWFFSNDQASAFDALFGTIEPDIFYSSWKMLKQSSYKANGENGRIIHEVSTNGSVYDKGRMEESQSYIITAWNIFRWTGNISFLKDNYEHGKKVWKWLQEHDTDHNGYIEGYGGAEIEGLNSEMLDVQVATAVFLKTMADMAIDFKRYGCSKNLPSESGAVTDKYKQGLVGTDRKKIWRFYIRQRKSNQHHRFSIGKKSRPGPKCMGTKKTDRTESIYSKRQLSISCLCRIL